MASSNPNAPDFGLLPHDLPIFPLTGALLLPQGQLPLNIFEPRYKAMVEDAMEGAHMIGMIQPKEQLDGRNEIYKTGCAGTITEFSETGDGKYLIMLTGACRFHIGEELETTRGYRRVKPDWTAFKQDLETKTDLGVDRDKLRTVLGQYFESEGMSCDFNKFETIQDSQLLTCLSMICPLTPSEKQALLETVCCKQRAEMFMTMIEMAVKILDKNKAQCH